MEVKEGVRKMKEREGEKVVCDEGVKYGREGGEDVEGVFGKVKKKKELKRLDVGGVKKVEIELGVVGIGDNVGKIGC